MGAWIRKWHVILAVVLGVYLAIPKTTDPLTEFGASYAFPTGTALVDMDGNEFTLRRAVDYVEDQDDDGTWFFLFSGKDVNMKKKAETDKEAPKAPNSLRVEATPLVRKMLEKQSAVQLNLPWSRFKPNLGQDLAGGTSLRYKISSGDVADAQGRMKEILLGWKRENATTGVKEFDKAIFDPVFVTKAEAFLSALDRGSMPDRPGDDLLPTTAEIEKLKTTSLSKDQIKALEHVREEFKRLAALERRDLVEPTIALLEKRLNSSGMTELNIVKAGDNEIEVKLPALPPAQLKQIKDTLSTTGRLEFILLPSTEVWGSSNAKDTYPGLPEEDAHRYRWYDVDGSVIASSLFEQGALSYDNGRKAYVETVKRDKASTPAFAAREWTVVTENAWIETKFTDKAGKEHKAWVTPEKILVQTSYPAADNPDADMRGYPIKGTALKNAEASSDETGRPAVSFELQGEGVSVMEAITKAHNTEDQSDTKLHRNLAVAIDKAIYSAPTINATLSDRIQVSGAFTRAEVKGYVEILKSGSLSVELTPLGEESIGPAEGQDNINRGMLSLFLGAGLVLLFALVFYRKTGVLTMLNLILTIVLILAIMSLFLSTLTLPGIAGLVLTLGMAIDANILINERIREERANGVSPRTAIEQGFKKAFSAIVDGNVTTLITALILAKVGTGAVAGFALTLSVGILCTLYTSLLVYRTTLFFCYDKEIITDVTGAKLFQNSKFNILKVGSRLTVVNFVFMIAAFSFFCYDAADGDVFGIDFRGGTQIVIQLDKNKTRKEVTDEVKAIKDADKNVKYPDVQVQARGYLGAEDGTEGEGASRWELRFPMPAGEAPDGEAALRIRDTIEADVRAGFANDLVAEGYKPSLTDARSVDYEIRVHLRSPEGMEREEENTNWLNVATNGEFENESNSFSSWFGFGGELEMSHVDAPGGRQFVTFAAHNVSVPTAAVADSNWTTFQNVIEGKFTAFPKAKALLEGGFPTLTSFDDAKRHARENLSGAGVATYVRSGTLGATVTLVSPVTLDQFKTAYLEEATKSDNSLVASLTITAANPAEDIVFTITSAPSTPLFVIAPEEVGRTQDLDLALETVVSNMDAALRDNPDLASGITSPVPKASVIGGRIAGETQFRALMALVIALIAIIIYIGIRFKSAGWGYAAVAALIHDTMFTLGAIAVIDYTFGHQLGFDLKIDLNAIAALLTVIGYSLNDTIVIFDRIREELVNDLKSNRDRKMGDVINAAVNATLSRTMLTSISTFVVVLAMVFFGGPAIRTFAWTLLFGLIFGTYSSIFRAGPFLLLFTGRKGDLRATIEAEEAAKEEARLAEEEALAAISTDQEYDESDFADDDDEASEEASDDGSDDEEKDA